jgi:hypothetical protein
MDKNNYSAKILTTYKNLQAKMKLEHLIIFSIIAIIIIMSSLWIYNILQLNNKNCNNLSKTYKAFPLISSINPSDPLFANYNLRDYYIKTAYNACSAGEFKNDFVNICALKNVIKQGARCLDFEIYSINNKPVIATSTMLDYYTKETYNSINFSEVIDIISRYAFSGGTCPNPNDPLLLNFRIMSNNKVIYEEMANELYNVLENRLLDKKFSYENGGENLGAMPINLFMGKVIIIVDRANPLYEQTSLDEYVNISSGSVFMRSYKYNQVKNVQDMNELIEYNKKNMSIVLPDLSKNNNNPSASITMKYGCQLIGLSFQNFDKNMEYYSLLFDEAGYAFILKPESLRYIPLTIPDPITQNPELSYKTRNISEDYYKFNI